METQNKGQFLQYHLKPSKRNIYYIQCDNLGYEAANV